MSAGDPKTPDNPRSADDPRVLHWRAFDGGEVVQTACGRVIGYQNTLSHGDDADCPECEQLWQAHQRAQSTTVNVLCRTCDTAMVERPPGLPLMQAAVEHAHATGHVGFTITIKLPVAEVRQITMGFEREP